MASTALKTTLDNSLVMLFASGARTTVLRLFMIDPTRAYYQRQIESATGLPIRAVQRELERLTSVGLLYRRIEGNRTYHRVDVQFPLFADLRMMILKAASDLDRLRGSLAVDADVHLAFLHESSNRVLVITTEPGKTISDVSGAYGVTLMTLDAFVSALDREAEELTPYLREGVDILGRRDDVIWRRIEGAGFEIPKGKGVA